jgi:hypothetical protein
MTTSEQSLRTEVEAALAEVRREELKAAAVYGAVDAAAVGAAVGLVATAIDLEELLGVDGLAAVAGVAVGPAVVLTVGVALAVLVGEVVYRTRGPPCERFEAATVTVDPVLRTARDVSAGGRTDPMAERLYRELLTELERANSADLLRGRRLVAPLVVMMLLSVATVQLAAAGLQVAGPAGPAPTGDGPAATVEGDGPGDTTLQDGDAVLGDVADVSGGENPLDATVDADAAGGDRPRQEPASGGLGGSDGPGEIDAQRAGYSDPEEIEDATVIKEYSVAIRSDRTGDGGQDEQ